MSGEDAPSPTQMLNSLLAGRVATGACVTEFRWAGLGTPYVDVYYLCPGDPSPYRPRFTKVDIGIVADGQVIVGAKEVVMALADALASAGLACPAASAGCQ